MFAPHLIMSSLALLILLSMGCARANVYELPPPPPEEERRNVSLVPGEDARRNEKDFNNARASLMRLNTLLESKRFDEALGLMSQETVAMLEFVSPDKKSSAPATAVFTLNQVVIDGQVQEVRSLELLLAADLSDLQDQVDGVSENESTRRKEIFAIQPQGAPRKIVMIKEGDTWLLHRTKIEQPR